MHERLQKILGSICNGCEKGKQCHLALRKNCGEIIILDEGTACSIQTSIEVQLNPQGLHLCNTHHKRSTFFILITNAIPTSRF